MSAQHSTTAASEFPLFPQLTNSWLLTTDYQYSGCYSCCLEYLLPAPYTKHGGREHRIGSHLLSGVGVGVMTRRHAVKQSDLPKNHQTHSNQRRSRLPDCLRKYTQRYRVPENCGESFPMKRTPYTTQPRYKIQWRMYVVNRYCLNKNPERNTIGNCSHDGVRAGRGSPCAILMPLSMATSAPQPTQSPLPRTCSGFRFLQVGVPLISRPRKQKLLFAFFGTGLKNKLSRRVSSTSLCRSSTLDLPPALSIPASRRRGSLYAKPRPCRSLTRGGACLRAQPSRLCIAALPLLPTKDARIAGVCA